MPQAGGTYWAIMIHQDLRDNFYPDGLIVLPWQGTLEIENDCARLLDHRATRRQHKLHGQFMCISDLDYLDAWLYDDVRAANAAYYQVQLLASQRIVELGQEIRKRCGGR